MSENKKYKENAIEKLRAQYENILALMPGHVYLKDLNGVWMACNDLQAKDLGLSSWKECIGKTDYDFYSKEEADLLKRNDLQVMESGKNKRVEEPRFIENEEGETYLSQKVPLRDASQNIIGILGISFNITEIKKREAQLEHEKKQAEITLDNVIANLPEHVYWKDKNGVLLGCNDLQAKRVGLSSRKEVVGKTAYDMVAKDLAETERRAQADAINNTDLKIQHSTF